MKAKWMAALLAFAALVPSAMSVRTALAQEEDEGDAPQAGEALSSDQLSKKRRAVLLAIASDETVLINVNQRDMPASPDVLNLGRRGTKALSRCVSDNVDDSLRALCAEMLGRLGDRRGLAALQGALEAWSPVTRAAAINALRRIPDPSSVTGLAQILSREDEEEMNRGMALEALGVMNDARAIKLLRDALRNPPQGLALRLPAFQGLWKSRHLIERKTLVGDVTYALENDDSGLILAATFAAGELRAPELVPALVKLMKHADTRIRNRAVYALGKIGDKTATSALLAQIPHVRESRMLNNIAFALERLDPEAFYRAAKDLVSHKQAQIRMNAAFVLGDVRRPEGLPLLSSALSDKNDMVRLSAVTAIGKLDAKEGQKVLEKYVDDPNQSLKRAAIYAIYALSGYQRTALVHDKLYIAGAPESAPALGRALPNPVQLEAAIALGRAGDPRVTRDLLTCLELGSCSLSDVETFLRSSKSPDVAGRTLLSWAKGRSDLTDLVASLKPQGAGALARSEIQASLAHSSLTRALKAIDLAGDLSDAQASQLLKSLLPQENTRLRLHAAVALARESDAEGAQVLFRDMDNLPQEQLPSLVRLLGRVVEPKARALLGPELDKRAGGADVPLALAAAAVKLQWQPEQGIFRMLAALAATTRSERDLAEKYLVRDDRTVTTELLRRALAREGRPAVKDQMRRILDVRADRAAAKRL
ncbi:MAG TPA: HEAT repeat domain-containing protein [Polyangiaceae bacterium]|nr:HEAT repeat domain-containing protein [Polyangiaceae bacterium]